MHHLFASFQTNSPLALPLALDLFFAPPILARIFWPSLRFFKWAAFNLRSSVGRIPAPLMAGRKRARLEYIVCAISPQVNWAVRLPRLCHLLARESEEDMARNRRTAVRGVLLLYGHRRGALAGKTSLKRDAHDVVNCECLQALKGVLLGLDPCRNARQRDKLLDSSLAPLTVQMAYKL